MRDRDTVDRIFAVPDREFVVARAVNCRLGERPGEQPHEARHGFDNRALHVLQRVIDAGREQDLIANALLAIDHGRSRRPRVPCRQESEPLDPVALADAQIIGSPAFRPFLTEQMHERLVALDIRFQRGRLRQPFPRLIVPTERNADHPGVVHRGNMRRVDLVRLLQHVQGRLGVQHARQSPRNLAQRLRRGVNARRLRRKGVGLAVLPRLVADRGQMNQRLPVGHVTG